MSAGECLTGFFAVCIAILLVGVSTAYFSWAYSLVILKGYNWFLADLIGIKFTQVSIAAAIAMFSNIIGLNKSLVRPTDTRSIGEKAGGFLGIIISPWVLLLFLWILTLL
jgi:hypothetical protein